MGDNMNRVTIIRGIIIPYKWDDNDNICMVAISAAGERDYPIEMNGMGKSLVKHIQHQVRIEGILKKNIDQNSEVMFVEAYDIISWKS